MTSIERLKADLAAAISSAAGASADGFLFSYPELPENGELSFPCFQLAKTLKSAPPKIAGELSAKLSLPSGVARAEAKGPYLNFFLDRAALVASVLENAPPAPAARPEVLVEYISPNNNKPLHLGHVRNGVIGESVSNLLATQGHRVTRALLLNDRGLAVAKAMVAYKRWHGGETPNAKGDRYVGDLYVEYEKAAKAGDETLEAEAHDVIRKWEEGDAETRALWRKIGDWAEAGQEASYRAFGFRFDVRYKESDIYKEGKEIVELGLQKGVFEKDPTGVVVAKLEAHGLPDKVVLRADGTSLYITQDLYLAKKKFEDHPGLERSIYVVGNEQNLHFKQLFKILELLGFDWAPKLRHLSYGYVTLPEGRMKSREGTVVDADDLLDQLVAEAKREIKERHADIQDGDLETRARQVALAAVKYHFLEVDIASDTVYDPKASLAFTGRTGPYLQYMHARVASLLRKAGELSKAEGAAEPTEEEFRLALLLARFPEAVERAASDLRPSLVAMHLYDIAKAFAGFYEHVPVLEAPPAERAARLRLSAATGRVLKNGLALLGIDAPEEM